MTQPTMIFLDKSTATILNEEHVVNENECARPDLIALQYYGDQSLLDIILKWNGISDPFSMNVGDIIEIPSPNTNFFKLERPKEFDDNPVKQQFIDGKRLSKKDQRRLEALKKKYGKDELLPPNVIPVGKKNYEFDGSRIILGADAQTDNVIQSINDDLEGLGDDVVIDIVSKEIDSENLGSKFEKIPGGVWFWTGSLWTPINPEIAQEVAGSLYNTFGNPNGNIKGTFEGQLYFDKLRDTETGTPSVRSTDDKLIEGQGNTNATGPISLQPENSADNLGNNINDGSNPANNTDTRTPPCS